MSRHTRDPEETAAFKGLGLAIKDARKAKGLSRSVLSEQVGLTETNLIGIEAGSDARWGTLRRIAYALEVPLPELLVEGERMAPEAV